MAAREFDERAARHPERIQVSRGCGRHRHFRSLRHPNRCAEGGPGQAGLYTIMLRIPANTRIAAHLHQDDRIATVVSGTWYIGYGHSFNKAELKALAPGSFYTEPANRSHFAETRNEPDVVQITGVGPSST